MSGVPMTRGEINDLLSNFARNNPRYRTALLRNARYVVEGQLNTRLPDGMHVKALEDTADTMHVVVPYVPDAGAELNDSALEMVAGGKGSSDSYDCHAAIGGQNTRVEFSVDVTIPVG